MRNKFEGKIMTNKLAVTGLICCILGTAGCVSLNNNKSYLEEECENGICTSNREYTAVCVENADGYSECTDAGDINYTRGAADFRQYGERMPRDHRITQAGAGNNISAAVPPSIDNEVIAYENGAVAGNYEQPWNPAAPIPGAGVYAQGGNGATQNGAAHTATQSGGLQNSAAQSGNNYANGSYAGNMPVNGQMQPNSQNGGAQSASGQNTENESDDNSTNKDWLAEEGQSLKELLTIWSDEAGWRLIWKTNRNYTLNAGAMFRGSFADVASALIRAFARARPAPIATFYKGNRVLVVETMEDENAYD